PYFHIKEFKQCLPTANLLNINSAQKAGHLSESSLLKVRLTSSPVLIVVPVEVDDVLDLAERIQV
ncbi:hypothetical protein, partial [Oleiphilus sp. HI0043]|uniref:hypothetical protein n=1 Tax=Oleiphilus sp. HI0043 TaxID=1822233 RepID=UPI001E4028ED